MQDSRFNPFQKPKSINFIRLLMNFYHFTLISSQKPEKNFFISSKCVKNSKQKTGISKISLDFLLFLRFIISIFNHTVFYDIGRCVQFQDGSKVWVEIDVQNWGEILPENALLSFGQTFSMLQNSTKTSDVKNVINRGLNWLIEHVSLRNSHFGGYTQQFQVIIHSE